MTRSTARLALVALACSSLAPSSLHAHALSAGHPVPANTVAFTGPYVSPGSVHKAIARGTGECAAAEAAGGRAIARYGDRVLFELPVFAAGVPMRDDLNVLRFRAGDVDTTAPGFAAKRSAAPDDGLFVVQFAAPPTDDDIAALESAGYSRLHAIPANGFLVRRVSGTRPLAELPGIQWAGPYAAEWRVDPAIARIASATAPVQASIEIAEGPGSDRTVREIRRSVDAVVTGPTHVLGAILLRVAATREALLRVARISNVVYVGRAGEIRMLDERADMVAAGQITPDATGPMGPGYREWLRARGLDGPLGVTVDIADSGFDLGTVDDAPAELRDAGGASRIAYVNNVTTDVGGDDVGGHGTINVSLLAGAGAPGAVDSDGYSYGLGAAPGAKVGVTKIFNDIGNFDVRATFSAMAAAAYRGGARISSNSWGSYANDYTIESQEYDALTRDALPDVSGQQPMLFVFAAGNFGTGGTITSPATAKNVLAVGAAESFRPVDDKDGCGVGLKGADDALDVAFFSSSGPTYDGRTRPDLIAPGTHMVGLATREEGFDGSGVCGFGKQHYWPAGQTTYTWSSGTSHSTPVVAGGAALLTRRLTDTLGAAPSPALLKAWLVNSTRYLTGERAGDDLPGVRQGWGMLDLSRALDDAPRVTRDQSIALGAPGDGAALTCQPVDAAAPVRVTLTWTDPPGSSAFAPQVNDLDLEVVAGGEVYRGNHFVRDASQPGGDADRLNTVEQVWLPAGVVGPFTVRVVAASLGGDGAPASADLTDQDFALVVYNARETRDAVFTPESVRRTATPDANGDGQLGPGETGAVEVTVRNESSYGSAPGTISLEAKTPGVSVTSGDIALGAVAAGATARGATPFTVRADASFACGAFARFDLAIVSGGVRAVLPLEFRIGPVTTTATYDESFEAGAAGWTHEARKGKDRWSIADDRGATGTHSWRCDATAKRADSWLVSPSFAIPADAAGARMRFAHTYSFEGGGFDGAVLELSDGGEWVDAGALIREGGYNGTISGDFYNPLVGRRGWIGGTVGDFSRVVVDLSGFRGKTLRARFRLGTDVLNAGQGWFIDDVGVDVDAPACAR